MSFRTLSIAAGISVAALSCTATAQASPLQVPTPALPAVSNTPRLLVHPNDVANLRLRLQDPVYLGLYNSVKGIAQGNLTANFANKSDDERARIAKAAAFMHVMQEPPPVVNNAVQPSGWRDLAVRALRSVAGRDPRGIFGGTLEPQEDAGRLQSMAEAFDMLRGSGINQADETAIKNTIADWADALRRDAVLPFQVSNLSIKSGAALVSAALAVPEHPEASRWLDGGMNYLNNALEKMTSATGWYREGPHYLNYSLNNLVSTCYHLENSTNSDWFTPLSSWIRFAIQTRQPTGEAPPFEEGLPNTFPFHVLLRAWQSRDPTLAHTMAWAWQNSPQDPVNYDNQQLQAVTAFLFAIPVDATEPSEAPTQFIFDDARTLVLRSDWQREALQLTAMAATDHATTELIESRHNLRNPMDVVVGAFGQSLLVTSGGGPTVTTSPNRSLYLRPSSRNLVLIDDQAPFLPDGYAAFLQNTLDSDGFAVGTLSVPNYISGSTVGRTFGFRKFRTGSRNLGYFVVVDSIQNSNVGTTVTSNWRGRGTRTRVDPANNHMRWTYQDVDLDGFFAVNQTHAPLNLRLTDGKYAGYWDQEEDIQAVRVEQVTPNNNNTTGLVHLAVLAPHQTIAPAEIQADPQAGINLDGYQNTLLQPSDSHTAAMQLVSSSANPSANAGAAADVNTEEHIILASSQPAQISSVVHTDLHTQSRVTYEAAATLAIFAHVPFTQDIANHEAVSVESVYASNTIGVSSDVNHFFLFPAGNIATRYETVPSNLPAVLAGQLASDATGIWQLDLSGIDPTASSIHLQIQKLDQVDLTKRVLLVDDTYTPILYTQEVRYLSTNPVGMALDDPRNLLTTLDADLPLDTGHTYFVLPTDESLPIFNPDAGNDAGVVGPDDAGNDAGNPDILDGGAGIDAGLVTDAGDPIVSETDAGADNNNNNNNNNNDDTNNTNDGNEDGGCQSTSTTTFAPFLPASLVTIFLAIRTHHTRRRRFFAEKPTSSTPRRFL